MASRPMIPAVNRDGAVLALSGKYARNAVLTAFEMIGGVERLAEWADENPAEFYKSLFTKTITRHEEVNHTVGIEDELEQLDHLDDAIDADYEVIDNAPD